MRRNEPTGHLAGLGRLSRLVVALSTVVGVGTLAGLTTGAIAPSQLVGASGAGSTLYVGALSPKTISAFAIPASGNVKPSVTLKATAGFASTQVAFDANGDLWVANTASGTVTEFLAGQLAAGGAQTPTVTISSPAAIGLAFTGAGDLWVSHAGTSTTATLTMYPPTQLKAGGTPTVTISSDGNSPESLTEPINLAVDPQGALWVTNAGNGTLVKYTATQLTGSGKPAPAVTISSHSGSLVTNYGITFDASGNLWASNLGNDTIVEYKATQLGSSGDPTPAVSLAGTLAGPWQLAFDNGGNLWVANFDNEAVSEYKATQLTASGSPTPSTISGTTAGLTDPAALVIKQPPTVTSVSPATGPERGGTKVTVHGTGFTSATKVTFGSAAATTVKVTSPYTLTAVAPAGLQTVTVIVGTFAGTSATSAASKFTFVGTGYDLVGSDGGVFVFPVGMTHGFYGSLPGIHVIPNQPVAGMVATVNDTGYFLVAQDGGVFAFTAPFLGSLPGIHVVPVAPIVGIVAVDTDKGYFLVGRDGGVFTFGPQGTVTFLGSLPGRGIHVNNIIGMAATPSGNGYWLVSSTGTVYTFGAAQSNLGTAKGTPSPVSAIAGTATGGGYWITTQNGAVYAFGNAKKAGPGTLPAISVTPAHPVIGIVPTANTTAYWLLGSDGGIFSFSPPGFTLFYGSLPGVGVHVTNIVAAVPN